MGFSQKSLLSASGHYTRLSSEGWSFFTFSRHAGRKNNILAGWEASLNLGGSCGLRQRTVASVLSSASQRSPLSMQRSPPSAQKGTVLKHTIVQFVNRLKPSNNWPVRQLGVCVCTCIGQCDRYWTAVVMEFNAYWGALPGLNCNVREALNGQQCNRSMES